MGDELDRTGSHHVDVDDLPLGQETIHRGVHMDEVVACKESGFVRALDSFHGLFVGPHLKGLDVFEPGSAMVDAREEIACEVVPAGFALHGADEVFLRHPGIAAVVVYLVQGSGEQDGRIVALCGAEGSFDDCGGVGADGQQRHGFMSLGRQFLDSVQDTSEFRGIVFHIYAMFIASHAKIQYNTYFSK